MKFIFITMIVINLVYLASVALQGRPGAVRAEPAPPAVSLNLEKIALQQELNAIEVTIDEFPAGVGAQDAMCWLAGPFTSLLYAEYFQELLSGLGAKSDVRILPDSASVTELIVEIDELVEPMAQLVERLKRANFEAQIADDDGRKPWVTLGGYSDEVSLLNGERLAIEMGINVKRRPAAASSVKYWVEFIRDDAVKLIELINKGAVSKKDYNEIRQNVCLGVANS